MKISINSMRINGPDARYYKNQLQIFADYIGETVPQNIQSVCFGKQDARGSLSITLFDENHCVPMQRHFRSKDHLLGFVCGYNHARMDVSYI